MTFRGDDYFVCECCGAELPIDATFCPKCGASSDSGWGGDDEVWDAEQTGGYSDDDFDCDDFIRHELPDDDHPDSPQRLKRFALAVIVIVQLRGAAVLLVDAAIDGAQAGRVA
jgi:hypothetical protein